MTPFITWATRLGWRTCIARRGGFWNNLPHDATKPGVAHAEVKAVGSPHERIQEEAQTCDLILLTRGSHFRFIAGDDEGDLTLRKVLKDTPRPMVVVPKTAWPEGPVVIAYDGSLQAARALAAFEATGLGESGKIHVISVGSSAIATAECAERACKFLSHHKIDGGRARLVFIGPAGGGDPGAGSPPECRFTCHGCLWPAGVARVLCGVGDPHDR